ncbi:MAG: type IX secretion system membrane protein PorP/SprF [Flavisolibacter sp.]
MKKFLMIILNPIFLIVLHAQQRPQYTQYILNNYILNPALTGIENYVDLKISARDQWVGLNGAPRTAYLSIHAPIGKKDLKTTPISFSIPGTNPRGNAYWQSYTASEPHHGIGFSMVSYKTGLYDQFSADVSYAYHIGLSPRTNMSMGFAGGIRKIGYDRSNATPAEPNDPAIGRGDNLIFKLRPDLAAGIWIYSADYFAGLSAQQVIPDKVALNDTLGFKLVPHLFATAGYRFLINEDINAIPSVMFKFIHPLDPQFDLNIKFQYRDLLWLGGSYRLQNGYAVMVGLNVGNTLNFGYAYDFTETSLHTASQGTHEIMLGFLIGNRYADTCPRNIW